MNMGTVFFLHFFPDLDARNSNQGIYLVAAEYIEEINADDRVIRGSKGRRNPMRKRTTCLGKRFIAREGKRVYKIFESCAAVEQYRRHKDYFGSNLFITLGLNPHRLYPAGETET